MCNWTAVPGKIRWDNPGIDPLPPAAAMKIQHRDTDRHSVTCCCKSPANPAWCMSALAAAFKDPPAESNANSQPWTHTCAAVIGQRYTVANSPAKPSHPSLLCPASWAAKGMMHTRAADRQTGGRHCAIQAQEGTKRTKSAPGLRPATVLVDLPSFEHLHLNEYVCAHTHTCRPVTNCRMQPRLLCS